MDVLYFFHHYAHKQFDRKIKFGEILSIEKNMEI